MSNLQIPQQVDPYRMAKTRQSLNGAWPLAKLLRVQELLLQREGEVEVQLQFGIDEHEFPYIEGWVKAQLVMRCERCLQAMDYPLEQSFRLSPVQSEEAIEALPVKYEAIFVNNGKISVNNLIEDELLLGLPFVVKHEQGQCAQNGEVN